MGLTSAYTALTGLTSGHELSDPDKKWVEASLGVLKKKMLEDEAEISRLKAELNGDESMDDLFWMRRQSRGYLIWHYYKTEASRAKWAAIYHERGDTIWMNADGSTNGLYFLVPGTEWTP